MIRKYEEILYKEVEGHGLYLDFMIPDDVVNPPVVMWIHGGGWIELKRSWSLVNPLLERGYAIAAVDYRYCDEAPLWEIMKDLKDALLYIRTHAAEYGCDSSKIAVSGDSAGAHLCCLLGVSEGNKEWETQEGDYSVQAIIDISGPVSFLDMLHDQESKERHDELFGDLLLCTSSSKAIYAKAALASAETYIDGTEPPTLIIQGSEDPVVNPSFARHFRNALEDAGDAVHMYYVPGAKHSIGGPLVEGIMAEFLDYYLKQVYTCTEPPVLKTDFRTIPRVKK